MAENRQTRSGRKVKVSYIKDGVVVHATGTPQVVNSAPSKLLKEKYLTPKGKLRLANKEISKDDAWLMYGKNRYIKNPDSKPIKVIVHNN